MIIVRLNGGLGNQLFQYATAKSIALQLDHKLLIDNSWFEKINQIEDFSHENATTKRDYSLKFYNIKSEVVSEFYINWINRIKIYSKNSRLFNMFSNIFLKRYKYTTFSSNEFELDKMKTEKRVYLTGYWQNNPIIDDYRNQILGELTLKKDVNSLNKAFLDEINNSNSVAIHFRRGDYISKPNSKRHHVNLTNHYYSQAIEYINQVVDNPFFYVFSDEIDWVKINVDLPNNIKFIDSGGEAHEHLQLMTACKHFITANSTFSWWGAWLSKNENKIVISPKYWYNNLEFNDKIIRIPSNWIKINNIIN